MHSAISGIVGAVVWLASGAAQANLIRNPSFEDGDTGWKSRNFVLGHAPRWTNTGERAARLIYCSDASCLDTPGKGAYISQLLDTQAGVFYELSFWAKGGLGESAFSVYWDGQLLHQSSTPGRVMVRYHFSGLDGGAAGSVLQLHGFNAINRYMSFDDVSVTAMLPPDAAVAVREPSTWLMLCAGLGLLAFVRRK